MGSQLHSFSCLILSCIYRDFPNCLPRLRWSKFWYCIAVWLLLCQNSSTVKYQWIQKAHSLAQVLLFYPLVKLEKEFYPRRLWAKSEKLNISPIKKQTDKQNYSVLLLDSVSGCGKAFPKKDWRYLPNQSATVFLA